MKDSISTLIQTLSSREIQLILLLKKGFARREIADKMCIAVNTYDSYRKNIREKLRIKNQADWARVLSSDYPLSEHIKT